MEGGRVVAAGHAGDRGRDGRAATPENFSRRSSRRRATATAACTRRRGLRHGNARSKRRAVVHAARDLHPRRAPSQPEESLARHRAQRNDRRHRPERLGQIDARLRPAFRRGPAPLSRQPQRLRAAVRRAARAARRRFDHRHPARRRHRAARHARRPQEHRRDHHGNLPVHPAALREARPGARSRDRRAGHPPDARGNSRAARKGGARAGTARARPADQGPQGLPHRGREVGGEEGLIRCCASTASGSSRRSSRRSTATSSTPSASSSAASAKSRRPPSAAAWSSGARARSRHALRLRRAEPRRRSTAPRFSVPARAAPSTSWSRASSPSTPRTAGARPARVSAR